MLYYVHQDGGKDRRRITMVGREVGNFGRLDQKNRLHIPKDILEIAHIEENSDIYVSSVLGENFIRVYPREFIEKEINDEQ